MSSATFEFGGPKCSRPRQSTFVRPQLGPVLQSTSMNASRMSTSPGSSRCAMQTGSCIGEPPSSG